LFNARTGLSQLGVASFVGVSTAALRNWEAGQSKPTAQNLKRLIELYVSYRAFAEGEEQVEAADLWEAAQERGLKVPFDEQWFQDLLANQRNLPQESEREYQPEQQQEMNLESEQKHAQEPSQASSIQTSDKESIADNVSISPSQSPETHPASSTHKLSRRAVVTGLACLVVGGAAGSGLTWAALRPQTQLLPQSLWTQTSNMLLARSFYRATLLPNGTVLVTGGSGPLQSAEIYDPQFETWTYTRHQMNYPRARHTATLLQTGEVLVVGGTPDSTVDLYNPKHDTWSLTRNSVSIRYDQVAIRLLNGNVLVAGGRTRNDNKDINKDNPSITNSAELYDPDSHSWSPLPPMQIERADFTAALLPDGSVMVIGGRRKTGKITSTTEIYDYNAGAWQSAASMTYPRLNPLGQEALQFDDGTILVVGGDTLRTSERYIPTTRKWDSVLEVHSPHYLGATVTLGNGKALVAGGFDVLSFDDKSQITNSTEIYLPGSE
jgi:transcriptional regulator with XRE-family HTH domain